MNTTDTRLAEDEARRAQQHQTLKQHVETKIDSHIAAQAAQDLADEQARIDAMAAQMRLKMIDEVAETESEVRSLRTMARMGQIVDYAFYLIYALLGLRFVLSLIGANGGAGFVRFVRALTTPFYAPFEGIVASHALVNGGTLAVPLLVALGVYALLHVGIKALLRMLVQRSTEI